MVYSIIAALFFDWRTGLSTLGLIPLIILSQMIQLAFIQGFTESKGKFYGEASQILNESVMNIRTVLSLGSTDEVSRRYEKNLRNVFWILFRKSLVTGFMFGVSNLLMFITFGLTFFLSIVFVTHYDINVVDSLSAIFLILFACMSAGNKANILKNTMYLN
jgi:ATP-binding cassette, subfamily B (MDR/TAP), member 1